MDPDISDVNPWAFLQRNDTDPLYEFSGQRCRMRSLDPPDKFICTRVAGHQGLHVASYSGGRVCCPAWENNDPRLRLPEGF